MGYPISLGKIFLIYANSVRVVLVPFIWHTTVLKVRKSWSRNCGKSDDTKRRFLKEAEMQHKLQIPRSFPADSPVIPRRFPGHSPHIPRSFPADSPVIPHRFPGHSPQIPRSFPADSPVIPADSPKIPRSFPADSPKISRSFLADSHSPFPVLKIAKKDGVTWSAMA